MGVQEQSASCARMRRRPGTKQRHGVSEQVQTPRTSGEADGCSATGPRVTTAPVEQTGSRLDSAGSWGCGRCGVVAAAVRVDRRNGSSACYEAGTLQLGVGRRHRLLVPLARHGRSDTSQAGSGQQTQHSTYSRRLLRIHRLHLRANHTAPAPTSPPRHTCPGLSTPPSG